MKINDDVPNTKKSSCRTTHVYVIIKERNESWFLDVLNAINTGVITGNNWSRIVIEVADDASQRWCRHDKPEHVILLEKKNEPRLFPTILNSLEIDADADTNARMVIELT